MTAQAALLEAVKRLTQAGVPEPAKDARVLLAKAMGVGRDRLTLYLGEDLTPEQKALYEKDLLQREHRQPVSQILGTREFFGHSFRVTQDVLDPRPETETLVLEALKTSFSAVLDIGTGSGCILISLLAERSSSKGVGVDISRKALDIAVENAKQIGVSERTKFQTSNWFDEIEGKYDLIVSNPPYIDEAEWHTLDPEPRKWEPKHALTPGIDGLTPYRIIAVGALDHLVPNGVLLVEIGWKQGQKVADIFAKAGFENVRILTDLDGRDRVVAATKPQ